MNIIELAQQAGFIVNKDSQKYQPQSIQSTHSLIDEPLKKFAELVAAHTLMNIDPSKFIGGYQVGFDAGVAKEREECAKLCFSIWNTWLDTPEEDRHKVLYDAEDCADAIRARSKA